MKNTEIGFELDSLSFLYSIAPLDYHDLLGKSLLGEDDRIVRIGWDKDVSGNIIAWVSIEHNDEVDVKRLENALAMKFKVRCIGINNLKIIN